MSRLLPPLGFKELEMRKTGWERRGSLPVAPTTQLSKTANVTARQHSFKMSVKTFKDKMIPLPKTNMFKEKIGTLTTRSESIPEDLNLTSHTVTIQIHSNHGNQTKITCSRIDILDINSQPIKLEQYLIEPNRINSPDLINLFSGELVKKSEFQIWSAEWPPKGNMIEIRVTL
ncbi:hypothetical protein TVAG_128630 [Trichomonas vaginalis G3]|uniref:Uncharacterized protein n=1 Tax=Trichomonas vaginalis (strain ATCC PRA-98 / G3) TaxID=412133 RepID=A2E4B4_TRIV3|nr:hypothetical protein TVAGG3_0018240 [Trichomonas vaginalis G3]EAY12449.1 hypothetical protein TVAG_128630 [Trichomonas vaginalis G3]KAI5539509.1 hypothetical protein TVAGG3_0018240 [Trichomonas vaginalis G3]|eukprot:XP_001324672.1 hypothetical protein [Trichomonas vaginalis G3]